MELEKEFANYICKASNKPQVWFLQLKWIVKRINKNRGSKLEDNIVMKVLSKAPEEYRTETLLSKNELKKLKKVKKTQLYLKEVRDLYNQGYNKEYAEASASKERMRLSWARNKSRITRSDSKVFAGTVARKATSHSNADHQAGQKQVAQDPRRT